EPRNFLSAMSSSPAESKTEFGLRCIGKMCRRVLAFQGGAVFSTWAECANPTNLSMRESLKEQYENVGRNEGEDVGVKRAGRGMQRNTILRNAALQSERRDQAEEQLQFST